MTARRLPLDMVSGLLPCCLRALVRYEAEGGEPHEGTVLRCDTCVGAFYVKDGRWRWTRDYWFLTTVHEC